MFESGVIYNSNDYGLLRRDNVNRELSLEKHRKLEKLLLGPTGFNRGAPIICVRDDDGKLLIRDGQHKLAICEQHGLDFWFVVVDDDFDVAEFNSAAVSWSLEDYVKKFANADLDDYQEALAFAKLHDIPLGLACALLSGNSSTSAHRNAIVSGTFRVSDRFWATRVISTYSRLAELSDRLAKTPLILALAACFRVGWFSPQRLEKKASQCLGKLVRRSTRDENLQILEDVYNHNQSPKDMVGLRVAAIAAIKMRETRRRGRGDAQPEKAELAVAGQK